MSECVYRTKSGQKHMFLFLTLEMSTVNKPNPRARVPTQHQTNCGAARVTYRRARANAFHVRTPEKALANPSSCCHTRDTSGSLRLALPGRISFEHPRVRGRSLVCGRRGESLFSLLLLQQSGSVCLAVCECVNVRVGRTSSRFPPHQLSRPLRTVPPFQVQ